MTTVQKTIEMLREQRRHLLDGQIEAILWKIFTAPGGEKYGPEVLKALLDGDLEIELKEAVKKWADQHGRLIPSELGVRSKVTDADRDYHLVQPDINHALVLERLGRFFAPGTTFPSAKEFTEKSIALLEAVRGIPRLKNLTKGVHLPICLPHLPEIGDYGTTLEGTFLAAVERSYGSEFSDCTFSNARKDELAGKVGVVTESRHGRLLEEMKKGPVVGLYFLTALQGFGIEADREVIAALPQGFLLSGALDVATAMVAYTATLARDWHTPGLDCAANTWGFAGHSLSFKGGGFGYWDSGHRERYSGGVLFLG